jgi:cation-transporting P-type ATPase C
MRQTGCELRDYHKVAQNSAEAGEMPVFVARNGQLVGLIQMAHPLRESVDFVFKMLRTDGIKEFQLLRGYVEPAVSRIAKRLGFETYRAAVSPLEKRSM